MDFDKAGWEIYSSFAVAEIFSLSATALKYASCLNSNLLTPFGKIFYSYYRAAVILVEVKISLAVYTLGLNDCSVI